MSWPASNVPTTNLDAGTDSPASARADLLQAVQYVNTFIAEAARLDANNFVGLQNLQDQILQRPEIKDYSETVATPAISAGTLTLDMETGNVFNVSMNANVTTLTITNPPATGKAGSITLILTQDGTGGKTMTWGTKKWAGGTSTALSTAANAIDIFTLFTINAGTTWYVVNVGKDFK
jgi:hypothetical protein